MSLGQLLVLHLMAGVGVAVAVYLSAKAARASERWFQAATAVVFWPLYLPLLLSRRDGGTAEEASRGPHADDLGRAVAHVEAELEGALRSLEGWADDVPDRERERLAALRAAWSEQAERVREMDRLLARLERTGAEQDALSPAGPAAPERLRTSQQVLRQNVERLRTLRQRTEQALLGTLAYVRELASMIHLAKFSGAPASRAEELVAQIAAAEGLSAPGWPEDERQAITLEPGAKKHTA
jgi:hypothetical protein